MTVTLPVSPTPLTANWTGAEAVPDVVDREPGSVPGVTDSRGFTAATVS